MNALKTIALATLLSLLYGCSHPIEIVGEGDVLSATGTRNCYYEDYLAGAESCSKNLVVHAYDETYYAVARDGWKFEQWLNYSHCADTGSKCAFNIPDNWVKIGWGKTVPPLVAVFTKIAPPNGVQSLETYETRIGEPGLLIEDDNIQMWVPKRYEEHSLVIFAYLKTGYRVLSDMHGKHEMPVKFSVEHYPPNSPYTWGGTDSRGTIRYGYSNLEADSLEWTVYGVPHVVGYYEEMAHSFLWDLGVRGEISVGFYETLGMMIGGETALRAAWNPHIQQGTEDGYRAFAASTEYYLEHNTCEPGIPENICLTRILAHAFKTEVVDVFGWEALTQAFSEIQDDYPLRAYARDHTWGGFLEYLSRVVDLDLHSVFGDYGLPVIEWTGDPGFETDHEVALSEASQYRFRATILDREGTQPTDAKLHIYGDKIWHIGTYDDSSAEFDADPRDDPELIAFSIEQPDSEFPSGIGTDIGVQRSIIEIHFSSDLSSGADLAIKWTPGGSSATDQFSISLNGIAVGLSRALSGQPNPYTYVTEYFQLPPVPGNEHVLRLEHLMGDGAIWDALQMGECPDASFPLSLQEGNAEEGWTFQVDVELRSPESCGYAFSANDGIHGVFQAIGKPTVKKPVVSVPTQPIIVPIDIKP